MSADEKKPREWWINPNQLSSGDYWALDRQEDGLVRIIEYSAYEALKEELDEAKARIKELEGNKR